MPSQICYLPLVCLQAQFQHTYVMRIHNVQSSRKSRIYKTNPCDRGWLGKMDRHSNEDPRCKQALPIKGPCSGFCLSLLILLKQLEIQFVPWYSAAKGVCLVFPELLHTYMLWPVQFDGKDPILGLGHIILPPKPPHPNDRLLPADILAITCSFVVGQDV